MANSPSISDLYAAPLAVAVYSPYLSGSPGWAGFWTSGTPWRVTPFFSFKQLEAAPLQDFDVIITHCHTKERDFERPRSLKPRVGSNAVVAATYDPSAHAHALGFRDEYEHQQWMYEADANHFTVPPALTDFFDVLLAY